MDGTHRIRERLPHLRSFLGSFLDLFELQKTCERLHRAQKIHKNISQPFLLFNETNEIIGVRVAHQHALL